jgi:hypothetical protein
MGETAEQERRLTSETSFGDLDRVLARNDTGAEPTFPVTLEALVLAFSWAADEAGYDLERTNDATTLILRAWRTVEKHSAWRHPAEVNPARSVLDEVTAVIPVVAAGGDR